MYATHQPPHPRKPASMMYDAKFLAITKVTTPLLYKFCMCSRDIKSLLPLIKITLFSHIRRVHTFYDYTTDEHDVDYQKLGLYV